MRRLALAPVFFTAVLMAIVSLPTTAPTAKAQEKPIVHDGQFYILDAQNGERWAW